MTLQKKVKTEIAWLPSIDSTNEEIKRKAAEGAAEGLVIAADMQTAGKGRRGMAVPRRQEPLFFHPAPP